MNKQKTLIFSLSAMLFLTTSFLVYSWVEPTVTMPGSYTVPINTSGTAQTKTGEFGASTFVDADDSNYYLNPSGSSVVSGKIVMEDSTASADTPTTVATKGYVDTEIARVESVVNGSLPLVYNMHTRESCTTAGGEVVDSDVSLPICKFLSSACPANWTQYKSFSTTTSNSCSVDGFYIYCCVWIDTFVQWGTSPGCTSCSTGSHTWDSQGVESCQTSAVRYAGNCYDPVGTDNHPGCSATATRTEIGCY